MTKVGERVFYLHEMVQAWVAGGKEQGGRVEGWKVGG